VAIISAGALCGTMLGQTQQVAARAQAKQEQAPQRVNQGAAGASQAGAAAAKPRPQAATINGVGVAPTTEDLGNLNYVSGPSGKNLPEGSGTAKQGAQIFEAKCSMCHGPEAHGVHWQPGELSPIAGPVLAGGPPSKPPNDPWIPAITRGAPFPEVIFNTIAVEMPMFRPGTLKPDEIYSLAAFIFFKNGYIKEDEVMNRETLPHIQLPNAKFFPKSDDVYMDMKKRGCYKTGGVCLDD